MPLQVDLSTTQKVRITAAPTTLTGATATLDGPLQAELVSGTGSFQAGASNLEVQLLAGGDVTQPAVFRIFGDADLGAGVTTIEDTVTLNIHSEMAANLGLVAGAPEPQ